MKQRSVAMRPASGSAATADLDIIAVAMRAAHREDSMIGRVMLVLCAGLVAAGPALARPPEKAHDARFEGRITYYARKFTGRPTASGERFDPSAMTMAHRTLPLGTHVRVTNLANSRSVTVRVNDRGPHIGSRVGDVSPAAARLLGMLGAGIADARLEVVGANDAPSGIRVARPSAYAPAGTMDTPQ
jgi:rare lipoprotein A